MGAPGIAGTGPQPPELLAPAGTPEAFRAALMAGADAIYCAIGNDFNARRSADNFDDESFAEACREAHLAGVRVYVTLNVLIKEKEMGSALGLARRAWLLGADALIVADFGLASRIHELWPEIELHVSTQANVGDARGVAWCAEALGADRVTLSRELSLGEIAECCATGVPCESFAHGAICFCYSGLCLMSSYFGGRSANRGLCAQPCRLPYELLDEEGRACETAGERLLCPKDLCTIDSIAELARAGAASLKVEGRMKAPEYVHSVISAYRGELDAVGSGADAGATLRRRSLKRAFNRDFTDDYLSGRSGNSMMSYERSNNRGEIVGEVVSSKSLPDRVSFKQRSEGHGRTRHHPQAELEVLLSSDVGEGDLLEVRPVSDPTQFFTMPVREAARAGQTISCTGVRTAEAGSVVRVIRSQEALDSLSKALSSKRTRPVRGTVSIRMGEPVVLELASADGAASVRVEGAPVEAARSIELTDEAVREHVGRMGASPFALEILEVELGPGCGMSFSELHRLRARACDELERALLAPWDERELVAAPSSSASQSALPDAPRELCALAATPAAAHAALEAGAVRIYAHARDLDAHKGWPEGTVPVLDEVCRSSDRERLDAYLSEGRECAVSCASELAAARAEGAAFEIWPDLPALNAHALSFFAAQGAESVWLSPELTLAEIAELAKASPLLLGICISGRARVMVSEHCVLSALGRCREDCASCPDRARAYSLENIDGAILPVRTDLSGRSRIYAGKPIDAVPEIEELAAAGISRFLVDGTLLDEDELAAETARAAQAIASRGAVQSPRRRPGADSGHLHAAVL